MIPIGLIVCGLVILGCFLAIWHLPVRASEADSHEAG